MALGTFLELKEDSFVTHADSDALQADEIWKPWGGQTGWTPPELSIRSSSKDWTCDVSEALAEILNPTPPERVSPETKGEPPRATKDIDCGAGCRLEAGLGAGDGEPQPASSTAPKKTAAAPLVGTDLSSGSVDLPERLMAVVSHQVFGSRALRERAVEREIRSRQWAKLGAKNVRW